MSCAKIILAALTLIFSMSLWAQGKNETQDNDVDFKLEQPLADGSIQNFYQRVSKEKSFNKRKKHFSELQDVISDLSDRLIIENRDHDEVQNSLDQSPAPIDSTYKVNLLNSYLSIVRIRNPKDCPKMESKVRNSNPPSSKKESAELEKQLTELAVKIIKNVCKVN